MKPDIILNTITLLCVCCQTLILFLGACFAIVQIMGARNEQRLGVVWEIFSQLDSKEMIAAREFVYAHKELYLSLEGNDEKFKGLEKEERRNAELVSSSFSRVGYVVSQNLERVPLYLIRPIE